MNKKFEFISASALAKKINIPLEIISSKFVGSGLIIKSDNDWELTDKGKRKGGIYKNHSKFGKYIAWPVKSDIVFNMNKKDINVPAVKQQRFREKNEAKHRTTDGHYVRSKSEMLIDNWLYMAEIVHAYEKKLPVEENVYSDFYIPTKKVYIEYWGYENNTKYLKRKKKKQEIYKKYNFNLIELDDKDIQNIDDVLPRLLLQYGIQTY